MKGMKNIIFTSKKEALTEKAFKQSLVVSVFCIVLCMIALCSVTWAYFSAETSTGTSNIKPAYCDVAALVMSEGAELDAVDGKYTLAKNKPYEIQVTAKGTASSAYCILKIGGSEYYTAQIPISKDNSPSQISFTLQFDADTTELEIITRWGTSSKPVSERSFEGGGKYFNLAKVDSLPTVISDSKAATDTDPSKQNGTDPATVTAPTEPTLTESTPTESTQQTEKIEPASPLADA